VVVPGSLLSLRDPDTLRMRVSGPPADLIADRGDHILLSVPRDKIREGSYLEAEISYLINEKGYRFVNQWSLRKPVP